ncbi:hypothetical protein QYM36_008951, partial [Artemia franciscana]
CINGKCDDPCAEGVSNCGSCAICEVSNHIAQCTCPAETVGDPLIGCTTAPTRCSANRECGLGGICDGGYCSKACTRNSDCGCKWNCLNKKCKQQCSIDSECPTNQFCQNYVCTAGCRSNRDCPTDKACVNRNCTDPCSADPSPCGKGAECRVSRRRPVCLCPTGTQGDPGKECKKYECTSNRDCDLNKRCSAEKKCVNPCEEKGACGLNAECKVAFRKAQCACPPGYFGNPFVDCKPDVDECQKNPCGANAKCTDTVGSYVCTCLPGCRGDPFSGCICPSAQVDPCKSAKCGVNAECRIEGNKGVCFCPDNYSVGDPSKECSNERSGGDCTVSGCGMNAKCVKEGDTHICKCNPGLYGDPEVKCMPDRICTSDFQCPADKACTKGKCVDPCSLRDVCGENALCRVVLHKSRCSCPQCFIGDPREKCIPDPRCSQTPVKPPVIAPPKTDDGCVYDKNCPRHLMCDKTTRQCVDPCIHTALECEPSKRCAVRNHKPICMCKNGYVLSDVGVLICGPDKIECRKDDDCGSNLACINFKCQNPCAVRNPCSANKQCEVLEHKPVCICVEDCKPSVSICLRDRGCPENLACIGYQCRNPCDKHKCPDDTPCYVEDHKPTCKFCPDGFKADQKFGCIKAIGCETNDDCGGRQACINSQCASPCELNTCKTGEACTVKDHEPVCGPVCACKESSDCPIRHSCDGCNCKAITFQPDRADDCEEPCADGEPNCYDGCFTGKSPKIFNCSVVASVSHLVSVYDNTESTETAEFLFFLPFLSPYISYEPIDLTFDTESLLQLTLTVPSLLITPPALTIVTSTEKAPSATATVLSSSVEPPSEVTSVTPPGSIFTEPIISENEVDERGDSFMIDQTTTTRIPTLPPQPIVPIGIPGTLPPLKPGIPLGETTAEPVNINVVQGNTTFRPLGHQTDIMTPTYIPLAVEEVSVSNTNAFESTKKNVVTEVVVIEHSTKHASIDPLADISFYPTINSISATVSGISPINDTTTGKPTLLTQPVIFEANQAPETLKPTAQPGLELLVSTVKDASGIIGVPGTLQSVMSSTTIESVAQGEPAILLADEANTQLPPTAEQEGLTSPEQGFVVNGIPGTLPPLINITTTKLPISTEAIVLELSTITGDTRPVAENGVVTSLKPGNIQGVQETPSPSVFSTPLKPFLPTEAVIAEIDRFDENVKPFTESSGNASLKPSQGSLSASSIPGTLVPLHRPAPSERPEFITESVVAVVTHIGETIGPIDRPGFVPPSQQPSGVWVVPGTNQSPPLTSSLRPTVTTEAVFMEVDESISIPPPIAEKDLSGTQLPPQQGPSISGFPGTLSPNEFYSSLRPPLVTEPLVAEVKPIGQGIEPVAQPGPLSPLPPPIQLPGIAGIPSMLEPATSPPLLKPGLSTEAIISESGAENRPLPPIPDQGYVTPLPTSQKIPSVNGIPGTLPPLAVGTSLKPQIATAPIVAEGKPSNEANEPLAQPETVATLPPPQEVQPVTSFPSAFDLITFTPSLIPQLQTEAVVSQAEYENVQLPPISDHGLIASTTQPQQAPDATSVPVNLQPVTLTTTPGLSSLLTESIVLESDRLGTTLQPIAKPSTVAPLTPSIPFSDISAIPGTLQPVTYPPVTRPFLVTEPVVSKVEEAGPVPPPLSEGPTPGASPPLIQQAPGITGITSIFESLTSTPSPKPQLQTETVVSQIDGDNIPLQPIADKNTATPLQPPQPAPGVSGIPGTPIAFATTVKPLPLVTEPVVVEADKLGESAIPIVEPSSIPPLLSPNRPGISAIPGTLQPITLAPSVASSVEESSVIAEAEQPGSIQRPFPEEAAPKPLPSAEKVPPISSIPGTVAPTAFVTSFRPPLVTDPILAEVSPFGELANPVAQPGSLPPLPPPQLSPAVTGIPGALEPLTFIPSFASQYPTEAVITQLENGNNDLPPISEQGSFAPQQISVATGKPGPAGSNVETSIKPLVSTEAVIAETNELNKPAKPVGKPSSLSPLEPPQEAQDIATAPGTLSPITFTPSLTPTLATEAVLAEADELNSNVPPSAEEEALNLPPPEQASAITGIPGTLPPATLFTPSRPALITEPVVAEISPASDVAEPIAQPGTVASLTPPQQAPSVTGIPGTTEQITFVSSLRPAISTEAILAEANSENAPLGPVTEPVFSGITSPPQQAPTVDSFLETLPPASSVTSLRPPLSTESIIAEVNELSGTVAPVGASPPSAPLMPPQEAPNLAGIPGTLPPVSFLSSTIPNIVTESLLAEVGEAGSPSAPLVENNLPSPLNPPEQAPVVNSIPENIALEAVSSIETFEPIGKPGSSIPLQNPQTMPTVFAIPGTQEPVESYPSERPSIVTEPVLAEVSGASGTLSPLVEGGKFPAFPNVQETPPTIGVPGTLQPIELNSPIRPSLSTEAIEIVSDAVNQQFRPVTKPGAIQPVSSPMGASTIDGLPGTLPTTLSVSSLRPELPTEPIDVEADEKLGSIQPSSAPQLPAGVTPPQIDTGVTGIPGTFPPLRPLGTSIRPQIPTEPVVAEAESIDNVIQPVTENAILTPFPPAGQAPGVTGIPGTAQPIFPATTFRPSVSTDAVNAEIEAVNKPLEPLVKPETPDTLPAPQEGSFVTGLPGTLEPIITVSTLGPSLQTEPVISEAQPVNTPLEPVGQQGQVAPAVPPQQAPSITGIPGTLEPISLATTSAPQLPTEPVISEADQSGASLKPIPEQGQANPPSLPQEAPSVSSIPGTLPPISSVTSTIPQLQTEPIISEVDEPDPLSNPIPEQGQVNPPPPQQAPPVSSIPGTLPPLSPVTPTVPQLVTEPIISQVDEPESLSNPVSEQGQVSPPPPPEQAPPVSSIPGTLPPVSPVTPTVPQLQTEPIISEVDQPDPLSNPIPEQGQANPPFPPPQQAPPVSSIPGTLPPLSPVTPTVPPLQTEPIISEVDEPESLSNPVSEQGQVTPPPPPQEAPPVSSIPGTLPPVSSMTPTAPQLQTEPIISEVDEQEPLSNPIPEQGQVSPPPPPEQAPPVSSIPGTLPPLSPVTPTAPQLQTEPIVSEVEEPEPLSNPVAEQGQVNPPPSPQQAPPVSGIPGTTEPIFQVTTFTPLVSTEAIAAETGGINEPPEPLAKPNEPGALPSPQEGSFVTGLPGTLVPIATAPTESPSLQTEPVISEAEQANVPLEPVAEQGQVSPVAPPQQAPSVTGIPGVLSSILPVTLAPTQLQTQPIVSETGGVNEPPEPLAKPNEPASLPSPQEGSFATGLPGTLNPIVTAPTTGPSLLTEPVVAEAEQANIPLEPVAEQGQASPVAPPQQSPSITGIPGAFSSISPVTFTPPQLQTEPIVSEAGGINEPLEPLGKPNDLPVLTSPQADSFVTGLPGTLKPIATAPTVGPSLETEPVISEAEPANVPLEPLAEQGQAPPLAPPQQVPSVTGIPGTLSPISPVTLTPPHLQTEPVASEVDEAEALSNPIPEQGQVSPFPPPQQAPSVTGIPGTLPPVSFVTPSVPQLQTEPIISEADVSEVLSNPVPEQGQANLTPPPQEAPPVTGIPGTLSPASFATPTIPQLQTEPVISEVGESGASLAPMPEQGQLNPLPPPQEVPSVSGIPGTLQPSLVITTTRPLLQTEPIVSEADENSGPLEAVAEQEPLSPLSPPQQAPTASGIPGTLPPLNLATSVRPELQTEAIISELGDSEPSLGPISQPEVLKPAPSPQPAPVAQGIPGTPIPSSLSTTLRPAFQTESVLSESSESNLPIQPIAEQEPVGPQPPLQQAPAVTSVPGTFPPLPTTVSFNPVLPTEEIITELENERSPLEPIGKPQSFTPLPPPQQAPAINGIPDTMPSLSPVVTTRPTFATEPIIAEAEQVSVSPSLSVDKGVTPFLNPPQAKPTVLGIPGTLPPQNPSLSEKQEIVTEKIQSEAELPNESLEPVVKPINLGTNNGLPVVAQSTPSSGLPLSSPSPLFPTQSVEVEPDIKQSTVKPIVDPVRPFTTVAPMGIVPQGTVSQPAFTVRPQDISTESVIAESSDSELPFVSPQVKPGGFNTNPPTAVDQETVLSTRPGFSNTPTAATENVESAFETSSPNLKPMTVSPTVIQTNPFPILAESVTVNEVPTSKEPPFISQENIEVETEPPKARPLPIAETQKPPVGSFPLGILQGSTTLSSTKSPLQLSPATEPIESEIESEQGPPFPVDKPGSFSTQEPAIVVTETSTIFPVATSLSPSRDEQQVLIACSSDSDCPLRESCINQACLNPCNFNVCGSNTECFVLNHKATCTCLAGFTGSPTSGCKPIPVIAENTPTVIGTACDPSPCGKNAECKEGPDSLAICVCNEGYEDRGEGCRPECETNSDCPSQLACINARCADPCPGSCGPNSDCKVANHNPMCACKPGFTGDAFEGCNIIPAIAASTTPRELSPCLPSPCGTNAICKSQGTAASCICPEDYTGDPFESCRPECVLSSDCPSDKICENRHCINPCPAACGNSAECRVIGHSVTCSCQPGFTGDPLVDCKAIPVSVEPIVEEKSDVCEPSPCGIRADCKSSEGAAVCFCPTGLTGDPMDECRPECVTNSDCPQTNACRNQKCVDPCSIATCGRNSVCQVVRHNPVCTCPPGFVGDPFTQCVVVAEEAPQVLEQPECIVDDECPPSKSCVRQICVDPCAEEPCAENAICTVQNHRAQCRCAFGFVGDPRNGCTRVDGVIGCTNDDCPSNEACINGVCQNPCDCGPNSDCKVVDHRPICLCKDGYAGDPNVGCYQVGCRADDECPSDTACHNGRCINPCVIDDPCAISAQCYPANHQANCRCPPGTEGDPRVRCTAVGCRVHGDCPQDKACVEKNCVDPCLSDNPCAPSAECFTEKHSAGCRCPDDRPSGDPAIGCEAISKIDEFPVVAEPECRADDDCPSQFACMDGRCKQLCLETKPCHETALCVVIDSSPFKSMACRCKDGMVPDESGVCTPVQIPYNVGCTVDSDCPDTEACINNQCRSPCSCGRNAVCLVQNHHPICLCQEGFAGNPQTGCYAVGCRGNGDCDFDKACHNGNCVNPCLVSDPCAPTAECFGMNHEAECRCPLGMEGNPREGCFVVGCRSDQDCPEEAACRNGKCVNPCLYDECGPRAECFPAVHRANCRCPPGFTGNAKISCDRIPVPECTVDSDCPFKEACVNTLCVEPCATLDPCHNTAVCRAVNTVPMRTLICACPDGFIAAEEGSCRALVPVVDGCTYDEECPSDKACINSQCKDPCNCGPHTVCRVEEHQPICQCAPGYDGDPLIGCYLVGCTSSSDCPETHACQNEICTPVCGPNNEPCGPSSECEGMDHKPFCVCPPGTSGNPYSTTGCTAIGCESNNDCPSDRACINGLCVSPCTQDVCLEPAMCKADNHTVNCICPVGYEGDEKDGCTRVQIDCKFDEACPSKEACINGVCVLPCAVLEPCADDVECKVADTTPVKTLLCECPPGFIFYNNTCVLATQPAPCDIEKGFIITKDGECICPLVKGFVVDEKGKCTCPLEKGFEIDEEGNCGCPPDFFRTDNGTCELIPRIDKECDTNEDCPSEKACETGICVDPCSYEPCGINAICTPIAHEATCSCPTGYIGNPKTGCTVTGRTDIPRPDMAVNCLADGVQLDIFTNDPGFDGVIYVKGHSKEEMCRKVVSSQRDIGPFDFKVKFGTCDLVLIDGTASFILVVQKHPQLLTVKAQAYQIRCVYETSTKEIELGFNVSMISTAGTIANTGPPPVCAMRICTTSGREISQAEIGDSLMLKIDVTPNSIYGGFARSCYAITSNADGDDTKYEVTDENGCPKDPAVFGNWDYDPENGTLAASFNAFKFPSSDSISFQCNVRVCFGRCQPVNCGGYEAYGRRKRDVNITREARAKLRDAEQKGLLREEITVQSNYIFTVERREERFSAPTEAPDTARIEEVCVNKLGFIIALIITALLALVAVAIAVSCWLMAYRRRPKIHGPLPHPPEFPNPLFTTPEPLAEPSPDYMS